MGGVPWSVVATGHAGAWQSVAGRLHFPCSISRPNHPTNHPTIHPTIVLPCRLTQREGSLAGVPKSAASPNEASPALIRSLEQSNWTRTVYMHVPTQRRAKQTPNSSVQCVQFAEGAGAAGAAVAAGKRQTTVQYVRFAETYQTLPLVYKKQASSTSTTAYNAGESTRIHADQSRQ